jgi:hypothetical protein
MVSKSNQLMMTEAELRQAEISLKSNIESVRRTLNYLEKKLEDGETIYRSDGIMGSALFIDQSVAEIAVYQKSIERLKSREES